MQKSVFALTLLAAIAGARGARAQGDVEEARRLFNEGSARYLAHDYSQALETLRASYRIVPSPNSELLIARCLRELRQPVQAVFWYEQAKADAKKRVADGDSNYAQTADVATQEGALLRATLGTLRVLVVRPLPGTRLEIDGVDVPLAGDKEISLLHVPGQVRVRLLPPANVPGAVEQSQTASLAAGGELRLEFGPPSAAAPSSSSSAVEPPLAPVVQQHPWLLPAAIATGGLSLVGFGLFTVFALKSNSLYSDLQSRCAPHCGAADQSEADSGKRDQTIANASLTAGILSGVLAVGFYMIYTGEKSASVAVGPRSAAVVIRFR